MTGVSVGGIGVRGRLSQISQRFHAAEVRFVLIEKRMER